MSHQKKDQLPSADLPLPPLHPTANCQVALCRPSSPLPPSLKPHKLITLPHSADLFPSPPPFPRNRNANSHHADHKRNILAWFFPQQGRGSHYPIASCSAAPSTTCRNKTFFTAWLKYLFNFPAQEISNYFNQPLLAGPCLHTTLPSFDAWK